MPIYCLAHDYRAQHSWLATLIFSFCASLLIPRLTNTLRQSCYLSPTKLVNSAVIFYKLCVSTKQPAHNASSKTTTGRYRLLRVKPSLALSHYPLDCNLIDYPTAPHTLSRNAIRPCYAASGPQLQHYTMHCGLTI